MAIADRRAGPAVRNASAERGPAARRILGIDPGLERAGYAVISYPPGRVLEAGVIRTRKGQPLAERLREIDRGIEEVLAEHRVDLVAVEELYVHYLHPRTAVLMGHARGVMLQAAARHGVEVLGLSATRIKRAIAGNGHAGKAQMQRAIAMLLNLPRIPDPPDVADALAAALCAGLNSYARGRA